VYGRNYAGNTLSFEPSGGLMNASLVMQDKQTDTYWSIMSGKAEAGALAGTRLEELPVGKKTTWAEWVAEHPDTLVLSVTRRTREGGTVRLQDPGSDAYGDYFAAAEGFRGAEATDTRLETKAPIHAFLHDGVPYAIDLRRVAGGKAYELDDGTHVFIFRVATDEVFRGSAAFASPVGFERRGDGWVELATGAEFDAERRDFYGGSVLERARYYVGGSGLVERLNGFDTFWYTWSLTHEDTKLLR
jgi:hypothetical protein